MTSATSLELTRVTGILTTRNLVSTLTTTDRKDEMKDKISSSPFSSCEKGHDLTKESAFIYDGMGRRSCRECATSNTKSGKMARKKGTFA